MKENYQKSSKNLTPFLFSNFVYVNCYEKKIGARNNCHPLFKLLNIYKRFFLIDHLTIFDALIKRYFSEEIFQILQFVIYASDFLMS